MIKFWNYTSVTLAGLILMLFLGCQKTESQQAAQHEFFVHYNNGIQLGTAGRFTEAKQEFQTALKLQPLFHPAEVTLRIAGDAENGVLQPKAGIALFRGIEFGNRYEVDQKIREINVAISLNPDYAPAYNERGIAYFDQEKYPQALMDRDRAIELEPEFAASYYNKALVCEKLHRYEEAITAYQGFIKYATPYQAEHVGYARHRVKELQEMMAGGQQAI